MATWTNIGDTFLEPGKPVRSVDGLALRDNPIAIAEGATGAPNVDSDTAIDWSNNGTGTTNARDWVLARTASASTGAVGTYSMLVVSAGNGVMATGSTKAGSALRYSDSSATEDGTPSGTWRNMGGEVSATGAATVMLRIA